MISVEELRRFYAELVPIVEEKADDPDQFEGFVLRAFNSMTGVSGHSHVIITGVWNVEKNIFGQNRRKRQGPKAAVPGSRKQWCHHRRLGRFGKGGLPHRESPPREFRLEGSFE